MLQDGRCGSRDAVGMAAQWCRGGEGHAVNCPGTTLHAAPHVRQRG